MNQDVDTLNHHFALTGALHFVQGRAGLPEAEIQTPPGQRARGAARCAAAGVATGRGAAGHLGIKSRRV